MRAGYRRAEDGTDKGVNFSKERKNEKQIENRKREQNNEKIRIKIEEGKGFIRRKE